ncbi:hypothetical protein [Paenibacillus terrae]|uniref:Uncharacterized protein n=1 Tax=Paenibacillus terrae TaxID=159743 RepID=A0A0D7WTY1_9BACL|nr:hypothetical protein [Paenibacillus terrae]KJD42620.1 hypothetical protein QD47_27205 [Paenibacillus terrae]
MELIIIFLVLIIPIVVGFCSGFSINTMTVDRSDIHLEHEISDEEHQVKGWIPTSLTQQLTESNNVQTQDVSSLPPEVEHSLSQLLVEIAVEQDTYSHPEDQHSQGSLLQYEGHDEQMENFLHHSEENEQMLMPLSDSDVPPPLLSNEEPREAPTRKLPDDEYNAIGRLYGYDFADQVTTTPSLGASHNEVDIMMGRLIYLNDGSCQLIYNRKSISLRGPKVNREMDGEVIMVKGFFLDREIFIVDETDRIEKSKEVQEQKYGS